MDLLTIVAVLFFSGFLPIVEPLMSDWVVPLEFSLAGSSFMPFGRIVIRDTMDAEFVQVPELQKQMAGAVKIALSGGNVTGSLPSYTIRSGDVSSSTFPCLFAQSKLAHEIQLTVDAERRKVYSLTVFPLGIYDLDVSAGDVICNAADFVGGAKMLVKVVAFPIGELPAPETAAYLQRIEDEKRARQHGATHDNRSFLAKYWMYIVPVVIFMVVSNAFNVDQPQQD